MASGSLRIQELKAGTRVLICTLSKSYTVEVINPEYALVKIQGGNFKAPTERILGGSYGPGQINWRQGFLREGLALRMVDPKDRFQSLEDPIGTVVSWEVMSDKD